MSVYIYIDQAGLVRAKVKLFEGEPVLVSRILSHSASPNVEITDRGLVLLIKDVEPDTELTLDYED